MQVHRYENMRTWTLLEVDIILEYPESVQTVYAVLLAGAENLVFCLLVVTVIFVFNPLHRDTTG